MSRPDKTPAQAVPVLMQLEPRLMFDGAAVETSIDTLADHTPDSIAAETTDQMFTLAVAHTQTQIAAQDAQQTIRAYLETASSEALFELFNGGKESIDARWLQSMEAMRQEILSNQYQVRVELINNKALQGALGAFSAQGHAGEAVIYLNRDWAEQVAGQQDIVNVLVEELGHSIDARVNSGADTAGDEGERFAQAVTGGLTGSDSVGSDGHTKLDINGEAIEVELATYDFTTAYEIVVDIQDGENQDWIADQNYENEIDKESNTHNFMYTSTGLGEVTVIDTLDSKYFSGNDVSAIGLNIAGETYYGWISRPIKVQGEVKGFYFWTDNDFTDLATAQADGNQDGDRNTTDNRAFVLAVDKAFFDNLSFVSKAGVADKTYKEIGSSSDRVDAALNALIDSNAAPTAPDIASGSSANTTSAIETGVGQAGRNATGNLLDGASDADGDALVITEIETGDASQSAAVGGAAVTLNGTYGQLTLQPDGSYVYVLNNAHQDVDALNNGDVLADAFRYTLSDGKGGTASATLTIRIDGSNDAPTANADVNIAKEGTTSGGSGFDYSTQTAAGNLFANETDPDDTAADLSIVGAQVSASLDASLVTVNQGQLILTFAGGSGFASIKAGDYLYVGVGSTTIFQAVYDAQGQHITISAKAVNDQGEDVITFSGIPDSYYTASGNQQIDDVSAFLATNKTVAGNSGSTDTTTAKGQTKTATLSVAETSSSTTLTNLANLQGSVTVGASVSGTGVPVGTQVASLEYDAGGQLTKIVLDTELASTVGGTFSFTGDAGVAQTLQGAHGTLVVNADGSYVYTPTTDNPNLFEGQSAVEVFEYTMRDSAGAESSSSLTIEVFGTGSQDPYLNRDSATATEAGVAGGSAATGNVLTNDKESFASTTSGSNQVSEAAIVGNTPVAISGATELQGSYGTLTLSPDGSFSYIVADNDSQVDALAPGQTLTETFTYKVINSSGKIAWSVLTVTVNGSNDAPVVAADSTTIKETATVPVTGNVLANDTDVDNGDNLTVSAIGKDNTAGTDVSGTVATEVSGDYGTLTIYADGHYSYTVTASLADGVSVQDTFTYQTSDVHKGVNTATLTIDVTGENAAPVNSFPAQVTAQGSDSFSFTGTNTIIINDADTNLSWVVLNVDHGSLNLTDNASVVLEGNGTGNVSITGSQADINTVLASLTYTAETGFKGTDNLTIMSQDTQYANDSDAVMITVENAPSAPVISFPTTQITNDYSTVTDTDKGYTVTAKPVGGTASADHISIVNTNPYGFGVAGTASNGAGGEIGYDAATGESEELTVSFDNRVSSIEVVIAWMNSSEHASYELYLGDQLVQEQTNIALVGNDGIQGPIQITADSGSLFDKVVFTAPGENDDYLINSIKFPAVSPVSVNEDGRFSFSGENTLTVADIDGDLASAHLSVAHGALEVTLAGDVSISGGANSSASLTLTGSQADINTVLASLQYTPIADFNGQDQLSVTVADSGNRTDKVTIDINVDPVIDAVTDTAASANGEPVVIDVNQNDIFDNPGASLTSFSQGGQGSVTQDAQGRLLYTPGAGFEGTDAFTYTVTSGGVTETATVIIDVTREHSLTEDTDTNAAEDGIQLEQSGRVYLQGASFNPDSVIASGTALGTLTLDANGNWSYSVANADVQYLGAGETKVETFTVTTVDGQDDHVITITLTGAEDPSNITVDTADSDSGAVTEDVDTNPNIDGVQLEQSGSLTVNDADGNGAFDTGSVIPSAGALGGLTLDANGNWSYSVANSDVQYLDAGETKVETFTVRTLDGQDTHTITIIINGSADAPVAVNDSASTDEDTVLTSTIDLDSNDTDLDGDSLSVVAGTFTTAQGGEIVIKADGSYIYTPADNFNGTDTVDYTVTDGALTDTGILTITVHPVNDVPVLQDSDGNLLTGDLSAETTENSAVSGQLMAADIEDNTLIFKQVKQPDNGRLVVSEDGRWIYIPDPGFNGADEFTLSVTDKDGATASVIISVQVKPKPAAVAPTVTAPAIVSGGTEAPSAPPPPLDINITRPFQVVSDPQNTPVHGQILVQRDIPVQAFKPASDGSALISFNIPADTFGHTEPGAEITLAAVMADGSSLPDWLVFDVDKGEFRGVAPQGYDGTLTIRVIARDQEGNQVETMVTLEVRATGGSETAAIESEGQVGFMQQLQSQSQFAWKAERDRLIALAHAAQRSTDA